MVWGFTQRATKLDSTKRNISFSMVLIIKDNCCEGGVGGLKVVLHGYFSIMGHVGSYMNHRLWKYHHLKYIYLFIDLQRPVFY